MKGLRLLILTAVAAFGLIAVSCIDDKVTDGGASRLEFSSPAVDFGTVFTGRASALQPLVVYNRGSEGVRLSRIGFAGNSVPFRLNVDGMSGREFSDIEIRGGDSLYVFIDCLVEPTEEVRPFPVNASLEFTTGSESRSVSVEATGWNAVTLKDMKISGSVVFTSERPYLVEGTLQVEEGASLLLEAGTGLYFHAGAGMRIDGTLTASGEPGAPVVMQGDRLDLMLPDLAYADLAGQWAGVTFGPLSCDNSITGLEMKGTVSGLTFEAGANGLRLKMLNCWLHNSEGTVLSIGSGDTEILGSCLSDASQEVIATGGGSHKLVQSTVANYYLFGIPSEPMVALGGGATMEICNGIVAGMSAPFSGEGGVTCRNVLFSASGSDDSQFVGCIWGADPMFYTDREAYIYDYRLRPGSPALGAGLVEWAQECPVDFYGVSRLAGGTPALGAYAE